MTAIQRWYITSDGYAYLAAEGLPAQWCKAQDVESLEALVLQDTSILNALRDEVLQLRRILRREHDLRVKLAGELEHATCHIESLQADRNEMIQVCRHEMGG